MAHDVFISYAKEDRAIAERVCAELEAAFISCWIAPRNVSIGTNFSEGIVQALHGARAVVLIFSGHANASTYVPREVQWASDKRVLIIPMRIENVTPSPALDLYIAPIQWIEAYTPPLTDHIKTLMGRICELITVPRTDSLPNQGDLFVGREQEKKEVKGQIDKQRLVTLTGTGGEGKTRLALAAAREMGLRFRDGLWFVDLVSIRDPALVPAEVARVVGVRERPPQAIQDTLAEYLSDKSALVILDNCEHLLEGCGRLASLLLGQCPKVHILATSRALLDVPQEVPFPVPPLALPPKRLEEAITREQLREYAATALFVHRAVFASPAMESTLASDPGAARWVAQICRRLDGIPLAIELAAARVKILSLEQISQRLNHRFALLTNGDRKLPRHETLQACFDWSYELLPKTEQLLLTRLSVFNVSCDLDAVEFVCRDEGIRESEIPDLLTDLVDKSLLHVDSGVVAWYRLLETVRAYAGEKLALSGDEERVRRKHADYFVNRAEQSYLEVFSSNEQKCLDQLELQHDNLRGALDWSTEHELPLARRLAGALSPFWWLHNHLSEGRNRIAALLAGQTGEERSLEYCRLLAGDGVLAYFEGATEEARAVSRRAEEMARGLNEGASSAISKEFLSMSLCVIAGIEASEEKWAAAVEHYQEGLKIAKSGGNRFGESVALGGLGMIEAYRGNLEGANALCLEALEVARAIRHRWAIMGATGLAAIVATFRNEFQRAFPLYMESLKISKEFNYLTGVMVGIEGLAALWLIQGNPLRAAKLIGAAMMQREKLKLPPIPQVIRPNYERLIEGVRGALGEAGFQEALAEGRRLSLEQAIAEARDENLVGA